MGFTADELVLELGYGTDCDENLRSSIREITGTDFLDQDSREVVDAVLIWWREGDGDLVDELMDAMTYLSESGAIWVLTPKIGRTGHVEPSDLQGVGKYDGATWSHVYDIGSFVTESLIAVGGVSSTMELIKEISAGKDFESAFQSIYKTSWSEAKIAIAEAVAAEYVDSRK